MHDRTRPDTSRSIAHRSRRSVLRGLGGGTFAALGLGGLGRAATWGATASPLLWQRDVVYGEIAGQPLLLDIASPPPRGTPRPAVILIHPGGLVAGDRSFMADHVPPLAGAGYVAVNIAYRLFSEQDGTNPWPAQLDDAQRAVRWVRANAGTLGVDPTRIGAFGHSSGALLAAHLGTRETRDDPGADVGADLGDHSSRVTCVVDVAGKMDLTLASQDAAMTPRTVALLGGTVDSPPEHAVLGDFSPVTWVDGETVPFLILHGTGDTLCPIAQSRRMVTALQEAGREIVAAEFPTLNHYTILDWAVIGPETLAFLGRHLHPEESWGVGVTVR